MTNNELIESLNNYLIDIEKSANEYLPIDDVLNPIQNNIKESLNELQEKSNEAEDIADKVFYINRYTDLVKKVESIFDTRSKRLQQALSIVSKISFTPTNVIDDNSDSTINEDNLLTPEQVNKIMSIINEK